MTPTDEDSSTTTPIKTPLERLPYTEALPLMEETRKWRIGKGVHQEPIPLVIETDGPNFFRLSELVDAIDLCKLLSKLSDCCELEKAEASHRYDLWQSATETIERKKVKIARFESIVQAQIDELHAISCALGTSEGHSSVDHIVTLKAENQKLRELCERAIDDAVDALEERDLKRRIADEIESRRKELAALTNSTN